MKLSFENIFIDATKTVEKIPQTEYLPSGQYPIIDQGQRHIAGYSNHSTGFCADVPAIIFGDHTRVIKYIDKPFFIGADGVKVLKSKSNATDYKYLFYALSSIKIPNTGYNRHFKWLKGSKIPVYNSTLQKRIAKRLDKVQELIAKQKEQIAKLDLLIKSRFLDMFGDPISNPKKWPCQSLSNVAPKQSRKVATVSSAVWLLNLDQIEGNNGRVIKKERLDSSELGNSILPFYSGEVLYSKLRPYLNKVVLADEDGFCTTELLPLHPQKEICNALFLAHLLRQQSVVVVLSIRVVGAKMPRVDLTTLRNLLIPLPPLSLQSQFANFVKSVEQQKEVFSARLSHLEVLYKALMQEYFG